LGHGGKLKDDCIACPFHLFYFNPNGEFVGTSTKGKPKSLMKLNQVEHRVLGNRIEVLV
jgi:phenylpropionate dioxygenase-like ring-hydroxylating dioxygenase large terminal subunit